MDIGEVKQHPFWLSSQKYVAHLSIDYCGLRGFLHTSKIEESRGGMAEWLKAAVLKTAFRSPERGFESLSLRHHLRITSHSITSFVMSSSCGKINPLVRRLRRGAGVVDQDRLLSDCPGTSRDRGFESHPLRHLNTFITASPELSPQRSVDFCCGPLSLNYDSRSPDGKEKF